MLKKFQDMGKLLKQAQEMKGAMKTVQEELRKTELTITKLNDLVKVVITGEMDIKSVSIAPEAFAATEKEKLERAIKDAVNEGVKRAKDLATEKLSKVSGGLMPG